MIKESELQERIAKYLDSEQSFEDLEDWLVENARIQYLDNSEAVRVALGEIRFLMFQLLEGEIDEAELREQLQSFVDHYQAPIVDSYQAHLSFAANASALSQSSSGFPASSFWVALGT